jgi:hypothetical protein
VLATIGSRENLAGAESHAYGGQVIPTTGDHGNDRWTPGLRRTTVYPSAHLGPLHLFVSQASTAQWSQ